MKKHILVTCLFDDADSVVDAINELRRTGFSDDQQGFVVRHMLDGQVTNALASEIIESLLGESSHLLTASEKNISMEHRKSVMSVEAVSQQEKLSTGIIVGGVIGATLGAVAILRLPDVGLTVVGGSLAAILANIGPGGIASSFLDIGIPGREAQYYEQKFRAGSIVFTIKTDEQQQEVQDILRYHRAHSIEVH